MERAFGCMGATNTLFFLASHDKSARRKSARGNHQSLSVTTSTISDEGRNAATPKPNQWSKPSANQVQASARASMSAIPAPPMSAPASAQATQRAAPLSTRSR